MKPIHPARADPLSVLITSAAVFCGLIAWLALGPRPATKPLLVYCAVAVKAPVEAAAREYQKTHGVRIELQFGASQTLLTNATLSHTGDLYLPADDSYISLAREKRLLAEQ